MRGASWVVLALLCACGDPKDTPDAYVPNDDAEGIDVGNDPNMPQTLAATGLCLDAGCTQIATDAHPYKPQFELYSDTATKRRWIYLPPGTTIDTSDMDYWQFPVGTKLWKEFTRGGIRVETRLIQRIGTGTTAADWYYAAYVWNATQDATTLAEFGQVDANNTPHDVPPRFQCKTCHENAKPARILGFSALSLDFDGAAGELDLADLVSMNLLSNPPVAPGVGPYFPFEAAIGSTTYNAIGYLHANCGHCHNPNTSISTVAIRLRLTVGTVGTTTSTPVYTTAVGADAMLPVNAHNKVIVSGMPGMSTMIDRFDATDGTRMPALGVELTDTTASQLLKDWITNL